MIYGIFALGGALFTWYKNLVSILYIHRKLENRESVSFLCSELGQSGSNSFDEIDKTVSRLNWYLYPNGAQKILLMIIANVQQPAVIKCFGNVSCSRDQFKKVRMMNHLYPNVLQLIQNNWLIL